MSSEDQYMERTPDLVAKIRAMRETAQKQMNRFTRVADYDVRRVVGHGQEALPVSTETLLPPASESRPKKAGTKSTTKQTSIEFAPAPAESGDDGEAA